MNKKTLFRALFCSVWFGLLLSGCSSKITEGEIYVKEYHRQCDLLVMMPMRIFNGNTGTTIMIPMWFHYPDRWSVSIRGNLDGKIVTERFWVPQETFDKVAVGTWFKVTTEGTEEPREKIDRPNKQI